MNEGKSFIMLPSYFEALRTLEDGDRLTMYDAVMSYVFEGREPELQGVLQSLFTLLRPNIDSSIRKYQANVENGRRGGRPRKHTPRGDHPEKPGRNPTETQRKPNQNPEKTQPKPSKNLEWEKEWEWEKELEKDSKDICTEPQSDSVPPVLTFPLNDGSQYGVTEEQVKEWASLYPAVDVPQALRSMRGWLLANPKKRKTKAGVLRFVTAWLSREQDKGGNFHEREKRPEPLSGAGDHPDQAGEWDWLPFTQL